MTPKISKEDNARKVAESRESRHLQRKADMAAALQRREEEKHRRIAARREAEQRREAARQRKEDARQAAEVVAPPPPLSVCPWESGAAEAVPYGGVM